MIFLPSGVKLGAQLALPSFVICRASLPSAFATNTSICVGCTSPFSSSSLYSLISASVFGREARQTIFLLSTFAEILVTTNGGPGTATTNLTYLVYAQSLLQYDVGGGAAGGIVAVILANIVAFFLMRMIGKNLET